MLEEVDIINAAVQNRGDREAWRHIYTRYYGAVQQTINKCGFTGKDAEDLIHRTFLKLISAKKKPIFESVRAFCRWLIIAAESVKNDMAKSRAFRDDDETDRLEDINELLVDLPDEHIDDGQLRGRIHKALEKLPKNEQRLVELRANGTPYKVIAQETGFPENGIRVRFQRAAKKLRELLTTEGIAV